MITVPYVVHYILIVMYCFFSLRLNYFMAVTVYGQMMHQMRRTIDYIMLTTVIIFFKFNCFVTIIMVKANEEYLEKFLKEQYNYQIETI